jgi:hypothetical protein
MPILADMLGNVNVFNYILLFILYFLFIKSTKILFFLNFSL